ncbi:MAG: sulfatase-like hydrolase/transferase [Terriglobales bacterium]
MSLRKLLLEILFLAGSSSASFAAPANIILITLDTTRADRMGFLGSKRGLTPNLDGLARQGVVFSYAYAHVPLTTPSHATILTGTYPQFNLVSDLGSPLVEYVPYLPDVLHKHGYHTAAFVGSQVLDPKSVAAPGFDRSFDTYDAGFHNRQGGEDRYRSEERRAMVVVNHAMAWLNQHPRSPFFLWVHLYDPHDPYDPPPPFKARYAASPYDGEIAYVDFAVGKLLAALRSRALYEGSLIAVVADHGEAFGEHGERSHGLFLYDETVHVPLLLKLTGHESRGLRVENRVGLVDLAPTLLQEVGIETPSAMQGESLVKLMNPKANGGHAGEGPAVDAAPDRSVYAETDYPHRAFGWSALRALRAGKYLYIEAPERELYDQSVDSRALHNLAPSMKAVVDTMATQLEEFRHKTSSAATGQANLSPEQAEQLQALGYATSGISKSDAKDGQSGPDPKEKVEVANLLHQALLAMDEGRNQDAIPRLQQVLKQEPSLALANLELGRAWNNMEDYTKALPWLRKAVVLIPESGRAHYELGVALAETGDWAGSAGQLEAAVARAPGSDEMHFYLGMAYDEIGRASDAAKNFQAALQINPNHYRANLLLGRLLGMQNNPTAALPYLQKAVKLQPQSPDAHKFLANVYIELGQEENARRELAVADRLKAHAKP